MDKPCAYRRQAGSPRGGGSWSVGQQGARFRPLGAHNFRSATSRPGTPCKRLCCDGALGSVSTIALLRCGLCGACERGEG
eukprot:scaffold3826_cov407-Prasinococcus_capsulatus_cf.AAC.21